MNKLNTKLLIGYILLGALIIAVAREYGFFAFVILVGFLVFVLYRKKKNAADKSDQMPYLTKDKETHYRELGLSPQEIDFFRSTMSTAKKQIIQLQENMNRSTKLLAIDLRNDTTKVSKALFKELVKEPKKLHLANHFLYTHLPNIVDLTSKHLEIEQHEVKNKQTYEKLEESAQIIDQLSKLVKNDYEEIVSDDLDDLDVEMSIAKSSLSQKAATEESPQVNEDQQ
ncbi:TPA: 5-bromo-4-chloroindolyl phosphate hydrolysis protein [Enterococcus faecalis]|nr:5-bromo-4-chloroindolyl phosphate hydrolysis protein [Enterococcus faecalis]